MTETKPNQDDVYTKLKEITMISVKTEIKEIHNKKELLSIFTTFNPNFDLSSRL